MSVSPSSALKSFNKVQSCPTSEARLIFSLIKIVSVGFIFGDSERVQNKEINSKNFMSSIEIPISE